ncbi:hypothetical protein C1645_745140 [Glomus cerebriforme]|uniref:Uncharacterized protein n=1 Tax=Glomus cerebriforme TaxID=658196 RepID=A0A397S2F9_9GLOM|nr:hypothetical protein C1645_745140 [Glomus cerebriforme]
MWQRFKDYLKKIKKSVLNRKELEQEISKLKTNSETQKPTSKTPYIVGGVGITVVLGIVGFLMDKHYVGQSKDIGKRLNQHFSNGEVYFCQTKDELDGLEKQKIEEYNSFDGGYNGTGGNK